MTLSQKEKDVLSILVTAKKPMTIAEIVATNPSYTTNIVQPIIKKLSTLGLVEVAEIVFRKKSFARAFRIAKNYESILLTILMDEYHSFQQLFTDNCLLASLVESELNSTDALTEEINRLELTLDSIKKKHEKYEASR